MANSGVVQTFQDVGIRNYIKVGDIILKAVIDRFIGITAVVLFGDEEIRVDIHRKLLPPGIREGSWLNVSFELDPEGEGKQRKKIDKLLDKLKRKGKD